MYVCVGVYMWGRVVSLCLTFSLGIHATHLVGKCDRFRLVSLGIIKKQWLLGFKALFYFIF